MSVSETDEKSICWPKVLLIKWILKQKGANIQLILLEYIEPMCIEAHLEAHV